MNSQDIEARARAGLAATEEAGRLAADYYRNRERLAVEAKGVQDMVSEADKACEELIVARIGKAFPGDAFLGEEGGRRGAGEALWVIDPIDGTANFLRGIPFWCVSVGLLVGGEAVAGFIYDPVGGEMFAAEKGKGATLNGKPIHASRETSIEHARMCLGFSYRRAVAPHAHDVETLLDAHCEYSRLGSGALGMAYTAAGRFEGYFERHINAWDVMGGLAIVREAGGRMNDFLAGDALAKGNVILATAPALYEPIARLLAI
jgi:myo-inositol-1(or 4)-monophosphatase